MMALLRDCVRKILDDHVDLSRSERSAVLPDIKGNLPEGPSGDRRARRSRAALTAAFTELALERGYRGLVVNDVAERAAVGRSTLYTHFSGMDDLLAKSLNTHLSTIARCTVKPDMEPELERVISHFWQQRRFARTMLQGDAGLAISRLLVSRLEQALVELRSAQGSRSALPISLLAKQLGAGQLALLGTWLAGRAPASPNIVARLLHRTTYAAALASL